MRRPPFIGISECCLSLLLQNHMARSVSQSSGLTSLSKYDSHRSAAVLYLMRSEAIYAAAFVQPRKFSSCNIESKFVGRSQKKESSALNIVISNTAHSGLHTPKIASDVLFYCISWAFFFLIFLTARSFWHQRAMLYYDIFKENDVSVKGFQKRACLLWQHLYGAERKGGGGRI